MAPQSFDDAVETARRNLESMAQGSAAPTIATQVPHWFGAAGDQPVEVLSLLSRPGERAHIRAAPRRKNAR